MKETVHAYGLVLFNPISLPPLKIIKNVLKKRRKKREKKMKKKYVYNNFFKCDKVLMYVVNSDFLYLDNMQNN